jgi:NAD+ kinase
MTMAFKNIALIARQHRDGVAETLSTLITFLQKKSHHVIVEAASASLVPHLTLTTVNYDDLAKDADLVIVIGGDGSLLHAAKTAAQYDVPILGINRGTLGFLTDINPDEVTEKVDEVLQGHFTEESRFFLRTYVHEHGKIIQEGLALNDVVLLPGKDAARLIEFDIQINKQFVCEQRSDGLIVATPTGSTAYALSGGGPILTPELDAIVLVPMFPHTLSMRPIVVSGKSQIKITIANDLDAKPSVSWDGNAPIAIPMGGHLHIEKSEKSLRLIHPKNYNYFETLRTKLGWGH